MSEDRRRATDHDRREEKRRRTRASPSQSPSRCVSEESAGPIPVHPHLASLGALPITADDYFSRSLEFRHWLEARNEVASWDDGKHGKSQTPMHFNDLSSSEARKLFEKFVKRWNEGRLGDDYYTGKLAKGGRAVKGTGFKWGFAKSLEGGASESLPLDAFTPQERKSKPSKDSLGPARAHAPSTSTSHRHPSDLRLEQEASREEFHRSRDAERRSAKRSARELDEEVNPRATGREAMVEKRREKNRANREFESRSGDGMVEVSQSDLMGGGDSYQEALAARQQSSGRSKQSEAKAVRAAEKAEEMNQKVQAYRSKEDETMRMLKEMAKSRFG